MQVFYKILWRSNIACPTQPMCCNFAISNFIQASHFIEVQETQVNCPKSCKHSWQNEENQAKPDLSMTPPINRVALMVPSSHLESKRTRKRKEK